MASYRAKLPVVSSGGAVIKRVRQEATILPADSSSKEYTLGYSVDPSKSFITGVCVQVGMNSTTLYSNISLVRLLISSQNTVTLTRASADPYTITVSFQIVEYVSGVDVQRGEATISGKVLSVPISTVDSTKSFLSLSLTVPGASTTVATYGFRAPTVNLSDSSLDFTRPTAAATTYIMAWEVITYV